MANLQKSAKEATSVLERRVATEGEGGRTEWWLCEYEDASTLWKPVVLDNDGKLVQEPVWMPLPGSQTLFFECPVFECLYHGTRGPGKTISLLMDFAKEVGQGYGSSWRGILFRRQFGDLDDVVRKIEEWFPKMFPGFRFLKSKSEYMAVWPTGEALLLRHMHDAEDYEDYHGHEYPWIGWEELTQWEDDTAYKLMMSCSRPPSPGVPCRVRATTNPYGAGHVWVKKRFRLGTDSDGKIINVPGEMPRVAIKGTLPENFVLLHSQPKYAMIIRQAARNPAQMEAWLQGDWNVTSGGMVDDVWNPKIHVIPNFGIGLVPRGWNIARAYDHGQSHPFAVGWWLESNGEPLEIEGRVVGNVRGDLVMWMEWYGSTGESNEGVKMSARKIARGVLDREDDAGITGRVIPGPADTEIWSKDSRGTGRSPATDMEDEGCSWDRADKTRGSRVRGWTLLRTTLENSTPGPDGTRELPGMFVCKRCVHWLELIPPMPRDLKDPDEVPKGYEDHLADMTRYRLSWEPPIMWRRDF